jgi:multidrug resistance efflux pump
VDTSALTTLVPAGGLGGVLLVLVGYLLRQIPADRADYRASLTEEQHRTEAAEKRLTAALERIERVQALVDEERQKRRDAETIAATAQQELMRYRQGGASP